MATKPGQLRYDYHGAERARRRINEIAEVGPLPPCANPARREAAEADAATWIQTYTPGLLAHAMPPRLAEYARTIQRAVETKSGLVHVRLPRGSGKTSIFKGAALWAALTGKVHYLVLLAATAKGAGAILEDLWRLLENPSPALAEDYPEICVPIRELDGKIQRARSQTVDGEHTNIEHNRGIIVFPTVSGSPASGVTVAALGAGCAVRGLIRGASRPDFLLLDDLQTRKKADSPAAVERLEKWIQGDAIGLGGSDGLGALMASTPIASNDLSETFANPELHPEWQLVQFPLVIHPPAKDQAENWKEYDRLFLTDLAAHDSTASTATAYLREHPAMFDGVECLDPLAYGRNEIHAYQRARNLRLRMGREAFEAEYQLTIPKPSQSIDLTAENVRDTANGFPRGVLPPGTIRLCGFIDVGSASRCHWVVIAIGRENVMAVADYGAFPEKGRMIPAKATEEQADKILAASLYQLADSLYKREYRTHDGKRETLYSLAIDEGWKTKIVRRVCALLQSRGRKNTFPAKGWDSIGFDRGRKHAVFSAPFAELRKMDDGTLALAHDADHWKEYGQRAFLGTPLQSGSLCVFGTPSEHGDFSAQVAGERLTHKAKTPNGQFLYRWSLPPGSANHYGDAVSGALALCSYLRFLVPSDETAMETAASANVPGEPQQAQDKANGAKSRDIPRNRSRHRIRLHR